MIQRCLHLVMIWLIVTLIGGSLQVSHSAHAESPHADRLSGPLELFPKIEPFQTGYLRVSELHEIYYELCGNAQGKPVLVLHGGPGAGCSPDSRRFFNPDKFLIVLHDQRGAGRSRPYAELRENNTQNLVEDVERLRNHLKLGKVLIFGGSWGSTLGLAYGETYPQVVSGMVLRGIFTGTRAEIDHFYGEGVRKYFPEVVARVEAAILPSGSGSRARQLLDLMQSDDPETRRTTAHLWAKYETKIAYLHYADEKLVDPFGDWDPFAFSLIENHYMANRCFLKEGQLLRDAHRLQDIPITLINGRYDVICPPLTAYRLHQRLPKSRLLIVESAGHSSREEAIRRALLQALKAFE